MEIFALTTGVAGMAGVSAMFIVGGYHLYFWPQKSPRRKCEIGTIGKIDRLIKFTPEWVWIYSLFYYPFMLLPIFWIDKTHEYIWVCLSYFALLAAHVVISQMRPMKTPDEWRDFDKDKNRSTRFLFFIQSIDKGGNCLPSMHVAVATLTACHLTAYLGGDQVLGVLSAWFVVALISLSAVFTKQHFFIDLIWGIIFSFVSYFIFMALLPLSRFESFMIWTGAI